MNVHSFKDSPIFCLKPSVLCCHHAELLLAVCKDYALQQDEEAEHKARRDALPVRFTQSGCHHNIVDGLERHDAEQRTDDVAHAAGKQSAADD